MCGVLIEDQVASASGEYGEELSIAYMKDGLPISFETESGMKGLLVDIMDEALHKRLGIAISHHGYPWARAQELVKIGKHDAMITTPTEKRAEYGLFGKEPVLFRTYSIYVKKDSPLIPALKEIKKLEILKPYLRVDFRGNGWTKKYMEGKGYRIHYLTKKDQIWKFLDAGRADYALENPYAAVPIMEQLGIAPDVFVEIPTALPELHFHFILIVSKKSKYTKIIPQFDEVMRQMKNDGSWKSILNKWYGQKY